MSRAYFEASVQFYRQTRDRIQQQFFALSTGWPTDGTPGLALKGQPFDRLVVMSFGNPDALRAEILALRVPLDRVFWL